MTKPRARDLGLPFPGKPGPFNAITDVPGVLVGTTTLISGEGPLVQGQGPVRTGVTAILPFGHDRVAHPTFAGFYALNGNGEMTGVHWVNDGGYFVGPICISNTHGIGAVHHGAVQWMIAHYGEQWQTTHLWAMPVVAETYDGVLNDINGLHVKPEHAVAALTSATSGPVAEGNTGGGTGMICYEFKGGTGTSSREVMIDGRHYHMAALVQANHGTRHWLNILGVPVGRLLPEDALWSSPAREQGSIIVILATDMPMLPHQLRRVAKRAAIGIGRNGTPGGNNSGDIFLAFSTANKSDLPQFKGAHLTADCLNDETFDPIYEAVVQATEEAVVNAMVAAEDMTTLRPAGKTVRAIPHHKLRELFRSAS
jgi:D-aminopeptidase